MLRRWISGLLWLVVLACAFPLRAGLPETPQMRQISVADGLPSNTVADMSMDADGYLWLATDDGLARYDGINFRIWRVGDGLPTNEILSVHVDEENRVWAGLSGYGLAILDAKRSKFQLFNRRSKPALAADMVNIMVGSDEGYVWLGTEDGLFQYSIEGQIKRFTPRPNDPSSLPSLQVLALTVSPAGVLWVGTDNGVARWTGKDFVRVPARALAMPVITRLYADKDEDVWVSTSMGGSRFRADGSFLTQPWVVEGGLTVYGVLTRDTRGSVWLDAYEGLYRVDEEAAWRVPLYSSLVHGEMKPQWSDSLEDAEGGLWFSSLDAGLWYLPSDWHQFAALTKRPGAPGSLANTQIYQLASSRSGAIWATGTSGVLEEIDPESGESTTRIDDVGPGTVAHSVFEDRDGKVWLGFPAGVARFDPATNQLQRWHADDATDAAPGDDVSWINQDAEGLIWIASNVGELQARRTDGSVVLNIAPGDAAGVTRRALYKLSAGPDGKIWVASDEGVAHWDAQVRKFVPVPGLVNQLITSFAVDDDGGLWLAGMGFVLHYERINGQWRMRRRLDEMQGVPQVFFSGLVRDRRGVLWLGSDRGLVRFDPQTHAMRIYGIRDGLPGQEIIAPPILRKQDGRVLVSASHGVVVFDPASLQPDTQPPTLNLESLSVLSGDARRQLAHHGGFRLQPDERDLRVVAHLRSFKDVASHRYRFLLKGVDEDWVEVGPSGERIYNHLPHGTYVLQIMGATVDNVWSEPFEVAFSVAPAWWQTWWARSIALAALLLTIVAAVSQYRRRVRRRAAWQLAEHKRELAEQASLAKTRFLATLGHEVRTPMTGVLGMSELLMGTDLNAQQRGYTHAIQGAGKHLLRLVNDALDLAKIEAGKLELDPRAFDPRALVAELAALGHPIASSRGLQLITEVEPHVPAALHGDALRVRQILMNLLSNAIKFTERGNVRLLLSTRGDGVRFSVIDTGPGINAEQQTRLFQRFEQAEGARTAERYGGSGLGLAICQELALAMGGRIDVESTPGIGTRFYVDLPLSKADPAQIVDVQEMAAPARVLKILLVEDDPIVADVIVGLLQARGHQLVHAAHGLAAMTELSMGQFDIGLFDLDLPGLDGLALARQLRAQNSSLPLLAVTARADADAEPAARQAGFNGFLRKPVTGEMLIAAVEAALADALR